MSRVCNRPLSGTPGWLTRALLSAVSRQRPRLLGVPRPWGDSAHRGHYVPLRRERWRTNSSDTLGCPRYGPGGVLFGGTTRWGNHVATSCPHFAGGGRVLVTIGRFCGRRVERRSHA